MKESIREHDNSAFESRYKAMRRVTLVGIGTNLSLAATQITGGVVAQSQALIADGLHTLSDLFSDMVVLFAARHANVEADAEHPYGHGRIETLATVIVGLTLIGAGVGIGIDAIKRLFNPETLLAPTSMAIVIALVAIVAKESLYHYTMWAAKKLHSNMLKANAWHHRSDVVSSLVVFAGIAGTLAGLPYLDAVAAVFVAALIAVMGMRLIWGSVRELIDTGMEPEDIARIEQSIRCVDGVKSLHQLRTRRSGGVAFADVHIQVASHISVSEGHLIGDRVSVCVGQTCPELTDITVHIDPEDDQVEAPCRHLPLRKELLVALRTQWQDIEVANRIENVVLHYLGGRIHIELYLPLSCLEDISQAPKLSHRLSHASRQVEHIEGVTVFFR